MGQERRTSSRFAKDEVEKAKAKLLGGQEPLVKRAAEQGGSWRQGKGKNVVWTARYREQVGERLRKEMEKRGYEEATKSAQAAFWQSMVKEYAQGRDVLDREVRKRITKQLKAVVAEVEAHRKWCEENEMGTAGPRQVGKAQAVSGVGVRPKLGGEGYIRGCRKINEANPPGPPSFYKVYLEQVQSFIKKEEAYDHDIDETDIVNKFEELLAERLLDLWVKEKKGKSTEDERAEAETINTHLQKMRLDKEYARVVKRHLYWKLGLRSLVPTRKTPLDGEQHGLRARFTWQSFDVLQWEMTGFGGAQDV